ncbi:septum formation initiator family protein [Paenibacillus filicis]|uniref:Septum formation initiator family protein n=1 Tax=Paenibacillus gyeongsangnamensis TaxID=3388067 RepID=A0ABT4Q2W8_9BACL|nr:septum formation initiator family protein [Paenibacillus filicis]MCZ8511226.1 septum formation initiator family protein [Paenibacillus filicis]
MPAYMHGSLAVEQRTESQQVKPKQQGKQQPVVRSKGMPVQEKLLYLFTVAVCVVVAGLIIWRYAQIYEMNAHIKQIEKDIKVLEAENMVLKKKVNDLSSSDHLLKEADRLGFTRVPEADQMKAAGAGGGSGKAASSSSSTASASGAKKTKEQP